MGIIFSLGDLGDPLELHKSIERHSKAEKVVPEPIVQKEKVERTIDEDRELKVIADLLNGFNNRTSFVTNFGDEEIKVYKSWSKKLINKFIEVGETGNFEELVKSQDEALIFQQALNNTLYNTSRSRLRIPDSINVLRQEMKENIELLQSTSEIIKKRIEVLKANFNAVETPKIDHSNDIANRENRSGYLKQYEILIWCHYEGYNLTRTNAIDLVKRFGHNTENAAKSLCAICEGIPSKNVIMGFKAYTYKGLTNVIRELTSENAKLKARKDIEFL